MRGAPGPAVGPPAPGCRAPRPAGGILWAGADEDEGKAAGKTHLKLTTCPTGRKKSSSCSSVALYGMFPTNTDRPARAMRRLLRARGGSTNSYYIKCGSCQSRTQRTGYGHEGRGIGTTGGAGTRRDGGGIAALGAGPDPRRRHGGRHCGARTLGHTHARFLRTTRDAHTAARKERGAAPAGEQRPDGPPGMNVCRWARRRVAGATALPGVQRQRAPLFIGSRSGWSIRQGVVTCCIVQMSTASWASDVYDYGAFGAGIFPVPRLPAGEVCSRGQKPLTVPLVLVQTPPAFMAPLPVHPRCTAPSCRSVPLPDAVPTGSFAPASPLTIWDMRQMPMSAPAPPQPDIRGVGISFDQVLACNLPMNCTGSIVWDAGKKNAFSDLRGASTGA